MKKRIKVAVISQSMNIGGGEMMAAHLASYIDPELFDVKLFILSSEKDNQIKEFLDKSNVSYECIGTTTSLNVKGYFKLSKKLKQFKPDIVHEHLDFAYSWLWCLLNNCPLVATIHGDPYRMKNSRVLKVISLKSKQKNLRVIGCSKITAEQSRKYFSLPSEQIGYIYNPIELDNYFYNEKSENLKTFLHIGRFNSVKNHRMLLEAFSNVLKKTPKAKLKLAGDGLLLDEMKRYASNLKIDANVEFLGNVKDIPEMLKSGDVLVLSSLSEACPVVVLEAMASGLPVIATAVGGVPELVTDNGILVESDNAEEFANAMIRLSENDELRRNMSICALKNVKRYSSQCIAAEYQSEYSKLVSNK